MKKENIDKFCEQLAEVAKNSSSTVEESEKASSETISNPNIVINNTTDNTELIEKLSTINDSLTSIKTAVGGGSSTENEMTKEELVKAIVDACKEIEGINTEELAKKISNLNFNTSNENINSMNASLLDAFNTVSENTRQNSDKLTSIENLISELMKNPLKVESNEGGTSELKSLGVSVSEVSENAVDNVVKALPNQLDFLETIGQQIGEKVNVNLAAELNSIANARSEETDNTESFRIEIAQSSAEQNESEEGAATGEKAPNAEPQEPLNIEHNVIVNVELNKDELQKEFTPILNSIHDSVEAIPDKISSGISESFLSIQNAFVKPEEEKQPAVGAVVQPPQNNIGGILDDIVGRLDDIKNVIPDISKLNIQAPIVNVAQNAEGFTNVLTPIQSINDNIKSTIEDSSAFNVKTISPTKKAAEKPAEAKPESANPPVASTAEKKSDEKTPQVVQPTAQPTGPLNAEKQPSLTPPKPPTEPPKPKAEGLYVELTGDSKTKFESIHKILTDIHTVLMSIRSGAAEERRAAENSKRMQAQFGNVRSDATAPKSKPRGVLGYVKAVSEGTKNLGSKLMDFFTSAKVKLFLMLAGLVAVIVAFIWTLVKFPGLREKLVNWMKGVGVKLWEIWTNFWTAAGPKVRTIAIIIASLIGLMVFGPWGLLVGGILLLAGLWPKYKGIIIATVAALTAAALLIYFGPIGLLVGIGVAVVGAIYAFRKQIWDGLKSAFTFIGDALSYWLRWPIDLLAVLFPGLGTKLKNGLASFLSGIPFVGKHIKKLFGGEGEEGPDEKSAVKSALADGKNIEEEIKSSKKPNKAEAAAPTPPQTPTAQMPSMSMPGMPAMPAQPQPMTRGAINPVSNYSSSMNTRTTSNYAPTNVRTTSQRSTTTVSGPVNVSAVGINRLVEAISKSTKPCTDLLNQIYVRMASVAANRQRMNMTVVVRTEPSAYSRFTSGVNRFSSTAINRMFGSGTAEMIGDVLSPILITLNDMKLLISDGVSAIKEAFGIVDENSTPEITANNTVVSTNQTEIPAEGEPLQKYVVVDNALEPHTFESNAEYETYMQAVHNTSAEEQSYTNAYGLEIPERPEEQNAISSISAEEINANQNLPHMSDEEIENAELSAFEYSSTTNSINSKEQSTNALNSEKLVSMQQTIETVKKEGSNAAAKQKAQEKADDENKFDARIGKLPKIIAAGIASYFDNKELKIKGGEMSPMPIGNDKADPLGIKVV